MLILRNEFVFVSESSLISGLADLAWGDNLWFWMFGEIQKNKNCKKHMTK